MRLLIRIAAQQPDVVTDHIAILFRYDSSNAHFDVCVLHVGTPFVLSPHVDTVCLPPITAKDMMGETSSRSAMPVPPCMALGWGKDSLGKKVIVSKCITRLRDRKSIAHC